MNAEKDMIDYIRQGAGGIGCITPIFLTLSIFLILPVLIGMFSGDMEGGVFFAGLVLLGVGLLFGKIALSPIQGRMNGHKPTLEFLKTRNLYNAAVADFSSAKSFMDDRIRLGEEFIFGRYCCSVLRYKDIVRLYQHVLKVNSSEAGRELIAIDVYGNTWSLCKIQTHKEFDFFGDNKAIDQSLLEVVNLILSKNNAIAIGYQG